MKMYTLLYVVVTKEVKRKQKGPLHHLLLSTSFAIYYTSSARCSGAAAAVLLSAVMIGQEEVKTRGHQSSWLKICEILAWKIDCLLIAF